MAGKLVHGMSSTSSMVKEGVTVGTSEVVVASVECAMLIVSACRMSDAAALDDEMTSAEEEDAALLLVVVVSQHRVMKLFDDG